MRLSVSLGLARYRVPRATALVLAVAFGGGCGGESSGPTDGTEDGSGGTGGSSTGDAGGSCDLPDIADTDVLEELDIVAQVPSGSGGHLVDGTYDLVRHVRYWTEAGEHFPTLMRATARIRENRTWMDYLFDERDPEQPPEALDGFSGALQTSGPVLSVDTVCPPGEQFDLTFTASGDRLTLYENNEALFFELRH